MSVAIYMDEHVHRAITVGLRLRGVDVLTAQEDDEQALRALDAEFEQEDRQLAETGLAHYAQTLRHEEGQA